ncbi:palindromic element RPE1 domain-containing protein [Candidatus Tisiphia endosymbiont of Beris chalybata]|uniref:palindromic element RPE1 domain-containing protein n=1 Tax=Candidatus Tisiphia endosymbiont of Beris chalybata TaxID=3066262 RepID=UPI00312C9DD9
MHNLKIIEEFSGETKSSTAAYIDVREEQRGVSTTKLPIRLGYARGLFYQSFACSRTLVRCAARL